MKTVIITGAASGIGKETASLFADRGDRVIIADIDEPGAREVAADIESRGGAAIAYRLDVRDEDEWQFFSEWVEAEFGHADVLVNNAGVMDLGGFLETDIAGWQRMVDIDLMSAVYGSRSFAQQMIKHGVRGHIVNVSSAAAFLPSSLDSAYAVAKAAVLMATQSLRVELVKHGIGVSAICPGVIRTDLLKNGHRNGLSGEELERWNEGAGAAQTGMGFGSPDKVGRAIVRAVEKNRAVVPVNPEAWFIYYAYRISPALVRKTASVADFGLAERALTAARPIIDRAAARRRGLSLPG